jgi:hypothetical protein
MEVSSKGFEVFVSMPKMFRAILAEPPDVVDAQRFEFGLGLCRDHTNEGV